MSQLDQQTNCSSCSFRSGAVSDFTDEQIALLNGNCSEVVFEKGEMLFKQNSLTSNVIYIKSGLIKVHMKGPGKRDQIIKIASGGYYLGIPSIIGDKVNNYSATAVSQVVTCFIDIAIFKELLLMNSKFAYRILEFSCKEGLCNLHKFINQSQKHLLGRLAEALIYFSDQIYQSREFSLPISRKDLADMIGTTRESTITALQKLKNDGLIELNSRQITIKDIDMLTQISEKG